MDFPNEVRNALLQNAAQLMPITVGWSSYTICSLTIEEVAKTMRGNCHFADFVINTRRHYRASWQDGLYLQHREDKQPESKYTSPAVARVHESSFDGQKISGASRNETDQNWLVIRNDLAVSAARDIESAYVGSEYFEHCGFLMPGRIIDLMQNNPVRSKVLQVLGENGELTNLYEVELDGRKVIRLRILSDNPVRRHAEKVDWEKRESN